jgi:hypothetical protein
VNDFVALLIGVSVFALGMLAGESVLWAIESRFGTTDDLLAFGPPIRLGLSLATAVLAYRRALAGRPAGMARALAPPVTPP